MKKLRRKFSLNIVLVLILTSVISSFSAVNIRAFSAEEAAVDASAAEMDAADDVQEEVLESEDDSADDVQEEAPETEDDTDDDVQEEALETEAQNENKALDQGTSETGGGQTDLLNEEPSGSGEAEAEAETEEAETWEDAVKDLVLTGDRNADVVMLAKSQVGRFEEDEEGGSVYGEWYGDSYADWNVIFVAFVLDCAGIDDVTYDIDSQKWLEEVQEDEEIYGSGDEFVPVPGDIVFLNDEDTEEDADGIHVRTAVVTDCDAQNQEIEVVEGDVEGKVEERKVALDDEAVLGYRILTPEQSEVSDEEEIEVSEEAEAEETLIERRVSGEDYTVVVRFSQEAGIPEDADLSVEEVTSESGEYQNLLDTAVEVLHAEDKTVSFCRFLDISFVKDGEEIEPETSIDIQITYDENPYVSTDASCSIVHFAQDGVEVLPLNNEQESVEEEGFLFTQDSLSVVGTVITDTPTSFVNGEKYMIYENYNGVMYALYSTGTSVSAQVVVKNTAGYLVPADSSLDIEGFFWTFEGAGGSSSQNAKFMNKDGYYLFLGTDYVSVKNDSDSRELLVEPGSKAGSGSVKISGIGYYRDYHLQLGGSGFYSKSTIDGISELKVASRADVVYSSLQIEDDIKGSGNLKVDYAGDTSNVSFVWYKKKTGSTDDWEQVKRKLVTEINGTRLYNIDDEYSLNVALDEGEGYTYKVVLASAAGEPLTDESGGFEVESAGYEIPYYASLQNGSFETPNALNNYGYYSDVQVGGQPRAWTEANYQPFYIGGTEGIVWRTTASNGLIEVIRPDSTQYTSGRSWLEYSIAWHNVEAASEGDQFAELNAEDEGALYQDVLTIPGTTMHWSLDHRGRGQNSGWNTNNRYYKNANTYDTMYLLIMPTKDAEDITTQADVNYVISHLDEYPGAMVETITDNNIRWVTHSGDYTVPEGQYLTRYFFVSGATSSGNVTTGNHLDNVWFSTALPDPPDGTVQIQVKKIIEGNLTDDELLALKDKIEIDYDLRSTVNGNQKTGTIKGSESSLINGVFTQILTIEADGQASYSVEEDCSDIDVEGYTRTTTIRVVEENRTEDGASVSGTITDGSVRTIEVVNTYRKIYHLPDTGFMGTPMFTIGGSSFMTMATLLYIELKKRRNSYNK